MELNKIYVGNVMDVISSLDENSVDCIVTSPPYWGLRYYGKGDADVWWRLDKNCKHDFISYTKKGVDGGKASEKVHVKGKTNFQTTEDSQITECIKCGGMKCELGQEPTPVIYIQHLCDVFDACRRILKPTGTLWVNLGDTYSGSGGRGSQYTKNVPHYKQHKTNLPNKTLCLVPQLFAVEMVYNRGWVMRSDNIWKKTNPMPSPHKDRPTICTEDVYEFSGHFPFFAKQPQYYYNQLFEPLKHQNVSGPKFGGNKAEGYGNPQYSGNIYTAKGDKKNIRNLWNLNIWEMNTSDYHGDHFAVYPIELPYKAIQAGCPEGGVVFDPFMGSGTTAIAALMQHKKFVGADILERNIDLSEERIRKVFPYYDEPDSGEFEL